jgi:dTDP-4-dehydrorhamnose reductase
MALWAGAECSVVRIGDAFVDEVERTGHAARLADIDRIAALGARVFRQPVLWERTDTRDWSWPDARLHRLRELELSPVVGLVHHGSGPLGTGLLETSFVSGLAGFARAVAKRYPWVKDYTPVNEPLTTARFSGLYGHWYPHARSDAAFARMLLNECAAVRAAMRAVREVQPEARLVQTEDIGSVLSTPALAYQAEFENVRRFASLDLLMGRVDRAHPLWHWLVGAGGAGEHELEDFVADPCPPDIIGINYYVTSDRFLDERFTGYPVALHGDNGRDRYADVEAVRVGGAGLAGHAAVLRMVCARYERPVALTEVHLAGPPADQVRWLRDAWVAAEQVRKEGFDVRGVTLWSAFGAYDWDSLLTSRRDTYEAGVFDVRHGEPRATPLARVARDLALRGRSDHPLLDGDGWWARPDRVLYP